MLSLNIILRIYHMLKTTVFNLYFDVRKWQTILNYLSNISDWEKSKNVIKGKKSEPRNPTWLAHSPTPDHLLKKKIFFIS